MSASQTVFGGAAEKSCFSRFGAIGRSWRLSVVHGLNRRPARRADAVVAHQTLDAAAADRPAFRP